MIDEKEIIEKLDKDIADQERHIERLEQTGGVELVAYDNGRLDQMKEIRDFIKEKCTPEAATPEGADINSLTQVHYSTESEKEQ